MSVTLSDRLPEAWGNLSRRVWRAIPPLTKSARLMRLLRASPRPLIHPDARMIVIFSPKSACTSVAIWFFHQIGHAEKARRMGNWPHWYRPQYYKSPLYRRALRLDLTGFSVVRVVRDPFDRVVSSFRHSLRTKLANRELSPLIGRRKLAATGLSFAEFLDALERCDLATCNPHFGFQKHPLEDVIPVTHLINISIEDLFTRLNEVERDLGLPVTDFAKLSWIHDLSEKRSQGDRKGEVADAYTHPFTREEARYGPWPSYRAFLTPTARERIARLYAADIKAYGISAGTEVSTS